MFIAPSDAISRIESDRDLVNKRYDQLRQIAQGLLEFNFPDEDYLRSKHMSREKSAEIRSWHFYVSDDSYDKYFKESMGMLTLLKAYKKGRRNPDENAIRSVSRSLLSDYCFLANAFPEDVLPYIDADKAETNRKLDDMKYVCETMLKYGVTDSEYRQAFADCFLFSYKHQNMARCAGSPNLKNALELSHLLEECDFKPFTSFFDRMFRKHTMDENLKGILTKILGYYVWMTN